MSHLIDHVSIKVRSGDGGNGIVAWRREKYEPMGGPAGGNGGRGGHVFLLADADMRTLIDFRYRSRFEAEAGKRGGPKGMHGHGGSDLTIKVPPGTVVADSTTGRIIADLSAPGMRALVAEGGRGGRGNADLVSSTRRAPNFCEPGQPGIERELTLELKLLADVGIVGLPNAGKSTLLSCLTRARPKVADYPFSTLEPNLGVVKQPSGDGFVLADIPGLVAGASQGVGLGHKFLRHIERTRLLVHLVDAGCEDIVSSIQTIDEELRLYGHGLDCLPQIVVLNKVDLLSEEERARKRALIEEALPARQSPLVEISCATACGLSDLKNLLMELVARLPAPQPQAASEPDLAAFDHGDGGYRVERRKGVFTVHGDRPARLVAVTDMKNPESLHHLFQVLRAEGVIDELMKQGATPGAEVVIGGTVFSFGEEFV